jgi:hypothetical protein
MLKNDSEHWEQRAAEARAVAKEIHDPEKRLEALKLATEYEKMARDARRRCEEAKNRSGGDGEKR